MNNIDNDFLFHWDNQHMVSMAKTIIDKSVETNNLIANHKIKNDNDIKKILSLLADDITVCQSLHSICSFLMYISNSPNKSIIKAENMITQHENNLNANVNIYNKLLELQKQNLNDDDKYFVNELVRCYKKSGIELSDKNKILLQKLDKEIDATKTSIINHIYQSENKMMHIPYDKLSGMPLHIINTFENIDCDNVKIKLNSYNYNLCMTHIKKKKVRKEIDTLYTNHKYNNILEQVAKLIVYRDKHDRLLSFKNHSDYVLSNKMCNDSEYVQTFLRNLYDKFDNNINHYDVNNHIEQLKCEYGINDEMVKEYFAVGDVIDKIIKMYELMFSVKFTKLNGCSRWTNDMTIYHIQNDKVDGYLYLDLFMRDGKPKDIRCFVMQSQCMYPYASTKYIKPIITLGASFNKFKNNLCLLSYDDVIAIFHEFGHVMHHLFGKTKYIIFSGMSVEDDFIEMPSQMLEMLCYEPYIVKYLSGHYCKKDKMADMLINKIIKLKTVENELNYKKHILISNFDQIVHSSATFTKLCETSLKDNQIDKINVAFKLLYGELCKDKKASLPYEFIQLLCNSDSQHYGFLWSKMMAIDLYNAHIKDKHIDGSVGKKIVECIYQYGGMKKGLDMYGLYMNDGNDNNNMITSSDKKYYKSSSSDHKPVIKYKPVIKHHEQYDTATNNFSEIFEEPN